jgi:uncharacterized membrane protein
MSTLEAFLIFIVGILIIRKVIKLFRKKNRWTYRIRRVRYIPDGL